MRAAESRSPSATGPDWAGFVIFTAALASLVYGLIESNQRSFTDGLVLGCLAAAAVLLAVFVTVERRTAHPMFDLRLLRLPTFSGGTQAGSGRVAATTTVAAAEAAGMAEANQMETIAASADVITATVLALRGDSGADGTKRLDPPRSSGVLHAASRPRSQPEVQ